MQSRDLASKVVSLASLLKGSWVRRESFLPNFCLYAWFIRMQDAQPLIYRSASSLHMGCTSSVTLRAEPFQIVFNSLYFGLKLDWNRLMPTTAANASSLYFFLLLNNNKQQLVSLGRSPYFLLI